MNNKRRLVIGLLTVVIVLTFSFSITQLISLFVFDTPNQISFSEEELSFINSASGQSVLVGVESDYPPFVFQIAETSFPVGLSIDILQIIKNKTGLDFVYDNPDSLSNILQKVKDGSEIRIITSLAENPERNKYLQFTEPYISIPAVLVKNKETENLSIEKISDRRLSVAVGSGYGAEYFLREKYPNINIVGFANDQEVLFAVVNGDVDYGVIDTASATYLLDQSKIIGISVGNEIGFAYDLSFAVPRNTENAILFSVLQKAVEDINPEDLSDVFSRWIPSMLTQQTKFFQNVLFIIVTLVISILFFLWNRSLKFKVLVATKELRLLQKDLEKRVSDRTKELSKTLEEVSKKNIDLDNTRRAMLNILEDIDVEKERSLQLVDRLSVATEAAKIGIWEWEISINKIIWDQKMHYLYGTNSDTFIPSYDSWFSLINKDDIQKVRENINSVLADKNASTFFTLFRTNFDSVGSVRYMKIQAIIKRDDDGNANKMIGVNMDVTHEVEVDRAKTEFVSLASHQLKTPIGAIKWDLEMLLDGDYGKIPKKQRAVVSEVYAMANRMNALVSDFLNISRIDLGTFIIEPEDVDYSIVCDNVLKELESRFETKNHSIQKKYQKNISTLQADPKLLHIIFQNLLSNAAKYTPDGGQITVNIEEKDKDVMISVANTGNPIPLADQAKIFTKMFRASNAKEMDPNGNGLGLYLLKSIVENAGGRTWFESNSEKGTIFYVTFPLPGMKSKSGTKKLD